MSHPSLVCDSQTSSYIQQVCGVLASMLLASGICQTGPNSQGNMISADLTIAGELDTGSMKWIDERQVNGIIIVDLVSECYHRFVFRSNR